ncbi:exported hypothetical protein [Candidatus Sulfopaludibacter sp. SbA3]|nr:exported hypothetical protein [Candidatus Sulfopaludibacter sp. SbA3]
MLFNPLRPLKLLVGLLGLAWFSSASVTMYMVISDGPSVYSSSFQQYESNGVQALMQGITSFGTPGTVGFYQSLGSSASIGAGCAITTNDGGGNSFASWCGQTSPSAPYTSQTGNAIYFGLGLVSTSGTFTLGDITFTGDLVARTGDDFTGTNFGSNLIGIDGATYFNSPVANPLSQPLTALYAISFISDFNPELSITNEGKITQYPIPFNSGLSNQTNLNNDESGIAKVYSEQFSLGALQAAGSVTLVDLPAPTPEPGYAGVAALALGVLAGMRRKICRR